MATPAAALKLMRSICLSLPDTTEGTHFGKASFKVRRKIFATCGEEHLGYGMIVGLAPEHAKLIAASDPRFAPYREYPNCVFLAAAEMNDPSEVRELVAESYRIVAEGEMPKRRGAATKKAAVAKGEKSTTNRSAKKPAVKKQVAKKQAVKKPSSRATRSRKSP